jgi:hypothetical protein
MTAADALAASLRPVKNSPALGTRAMPILLVGAAGTLGEAILTALLASPDVASIEVATTAPLPSSHHKLVYAEVTLSAAVRPLAAETAVVVLGAAPTSYYGRDAVFASLEGDQLLAWCEALHARGLKRLVLVSPTEAHLQSVAFDGLVYGSVELQLVKWFACLTVIRPGERNKRDRRGMSLGQRLAFFIFDQLSFMTPSHHKQSDKKRVAALVATAIKRLEPGVEVFDSIDTAAGAGKSDTKTSPMQPKATR